MRSHSASGVENNGEPFLQQSNSKSRRRRRRRESLVQQQQQQQLSSGSTNNEQQSTSVSAGGTTTSVNDPPRRGPLMIGKSVDHQHTFSAARTWYRKAVFYIDNVDVNVSADFLTNFITQELNVRVVSCFEVQPRRRRNTSETPSKAFRLCINRDDSQLLLIPENWPAYVGISAWQFKTGDAAAENPAKKPHLGDLDGQGDTTAVHTDSQPTSHY